MDMTKKTHHRCVHHHHVMRETAEPVGERMTRTTTITTTRRIVPSDRVEPVGERTYIRDQYLNPESPAAHPSWENDYANPYR